MTERIEWTRRIVRTVTLGEVELPDLPPVRGRRRLWVPANGAIILYEEGAHPAMSIAEVSAKGVRFRDALVTPEEIEACKNVAMQIATLEQSQQPGEP